MTNLEKEYIRAYQNYLAALDDLAEIKCIYQQAAMAYFQSLNRAL